MKLTDLQTFLHIADAGTFAQVARTLRVPKSTVTRRVERLEADLGLALLQRSSRSLRLTEAGRFLHERASSAMAELDGLETRIREQAGEATGTLRVTLPPDLAATPAFARLLSEYSARHPQVRTEILATDRVTDLVEEGIDVAIRPRVVLRASDAGLRSRVVAEVRLGLFASVAWLESRGGPDALTSLAGVPLFVQSGAARVAEGALAEALRAGTPALTTNDFRVSHALICAGAGVGMLPTYLVGDDPRLVEVLPTLTERVYPLVMLWPASRHVAARVRAFIDLVAERPWFHVALPRGVTPSAARGPSGRPSRRGTSP